MRAEHAREAGERVARGDELAAAAGLRTTTRVLDAATPWRALRALAEELDVDAIVCGTRGEGVIDRGPARLDGDQPAAPRRPAAARRAGRARVRPRLDEGRVKLGHLETFSP
jgi:hypothetical protein